MNMFKGGLFFRLPFKKTKGLTQFSTRSRCGRLSEITKGTNYPRAEADCREVISYLLLYLGWNLPFQLSECLTPEEHWAHGFNIPLLYFPVSSDFDQLPHSFLEQLVFPHFNDSKWPKMGGFVCFTSLLSSFSYIFSWVRCKETWNLENLIIYILFFFFSFSPAS